MIQFDLTCFKLPCILYLHPYASYSISNLQEITSNLLSSLTSSSISSTSPSPALVSSLTPQFLALKTLHRSLQSHLLASKSKVAQARDQVDEKTLSLNDLKYEKTQLKKEIEKCRDFNSIYQNIPLCSVEEFDRDCDLEELRTEEVRADEHQFMLARLKWELVERQR